jgi:hypothetical protein
MIHKLKITPERLSNLIAGNKKAELRLNDRDYQMNDFLEFDKDDPMYEGKRLGVILKSPVHFKITHIHSGLGLLPGYVVLSVERVD